MNFKKICFISLFLLFLIINTACAYDFDNSTEEFSQETNDLICDGENDYNHDFGQWVLDENGTLVYVPSDENTSFPYFDIPAGGGNVTDLRNNNESDINLTEPSNQSTVNSPASMNPLWNEFIKDPQGFMEKYHSLPDTVSVDWDKYVENNDSWSWHSSKELRDFLDFVSETKVKPDVIESKDIGVFYSKNNIYKIRVLNPVGDSVGKGINVTFVFNSKKINAKTDSNGYASFRFNAQPGNYVVKAYAGEIHSKNKIDIKALFKTKNLNKKYGKSSKFSIKLIKHKGKSISKQTIKITFNGKNYNVKTNSKGIATFNISKNLKIGKHTIKSRYNGCVVKNSITVNR